MLKRVFFVALILLILPASSSQNAVPFNGGGNFAATVTRANLSYHTKSRGVRVPIVMYHSVCGVHNNAYVLKPATLSADFEYLKRNGFKPVFVSELVDFVSCGEALPEKPVVISFDDGFYNNLVNVLPLLEKYDFKASLSLVGSFTAKEEGEKKRSVSYSYLSTAEVKELKQSGRFEFCSHSYAMHSINGKRKGVRRASGEDVETYRKNFVRDVKRNEKLYHDGCGIDFRVFTYPYGSYSKETPIILKELGYKAIMTCSEGLNYLVPGKSEGLYFLRRYNRPSGTSPASFFEDVMKLKTD